MSSKASKRLVPELRFPEFRDAQPWKPNTVKGLCELKAGQFVSASDIKEKPGDALYPCYGGNGPRGYTKTFTHAGTYPLIGRQGALCGNVRQADGKFHATEHAVVATPRERTNVDWLFHLLVTLSLNRYATGQAQPGLSVDVIEKVSVAAPLPVEQKKIADCLSSIDDLITAQAKEIEALKAHKKGLMQQLFPAEGETVPRLRFPKFLETGDWKEKKAGTLFANRMEVGEAGLPIYSVTMNDGMIKRSLLDRDFDDIAEPEGNKRAHKHDIAYNMMRMWQGASGVAVEDCMVSPAYVILAPHKGVHSIFFGYLFKLPRHLRTLTSHSQGLTLDRLRLYYKHFAEILLPHPAIPEQEKVADCLSSVDELITVHTQKLEILKAHRNGLMQGLFPSTAEGEA